MTSFSSIFKELTKNKVRLVRRLVFLQIVVGILLGFGHYFILLLKVKVRHIS